MSQQRPAATAPAATTGLQAALAPLLTAPGRTPDDRELLAALTRIIGLADSIRLHGVLARRRQRQAPAGTGGAAAAVESVLRGRRALRDLIAGGCGGDDAAAVRFPDLEAPPGFDGLSASQRLERFHARCQQDLAVRVQAIRRQVREIVSAYSPATARLADLDRDVSQLVGNRLEEALTRIPRLLRDYCERPDCRRQQLPALCHTLLDAELDLRLQPVIGLVEAVEDFNGADTP